MSRQGVAPSVARQRHVVGHGEERAERGDLGGEGHEAVERQKKVHVSCKGFAPHRARVVFV